MNDSDLQKMRMRKLEKDEEDCRRLQISHRFMHLSALSPSTRLSHAERHGHLFTADEIREWLNIDGNNTSCKCAFTLVLVDEHGAPHTPALVQKVVNAREAFFARRNQSS